MDKLLEKLADLEHKRWSRWQKYLHSQCKKNDDGSLTIPKEKVERWKGQIKTDYKDLSEKEKESDRKEAKKTLQILKNHDPEVKKLVKESLVDTRAQTFTRGKSRREIKDIFANKPPFYKGAIVWDPDSSNIYMHRGNNNFVLFGNIDDSEKGPFVNTRFVPGIFRFSLEEQKDKRMEILSSKLQKSVKRTMAHCPGFKQNISKFTQNVEPVWSFEN